VAKVRIYLAICLFLFGHSRLSYHRSTCFAFYEHPIIAPKESQRNPGNLATFGIKNARRSAGEDELVVCGRVNQGLAFGSPGRLLDDYVAPGHQAIKLARAGK
jgi:hypothetical protein